MIGVIVKKSIGPIAYPVYLPKKDTHRTRTFFFFSFLRDEKFLFGPIDNLSKCQAEREAMWLVSGMDNCFDLIMNEKKNNSGYVKPEENKPNCTCTRWRAYRAVSVYQ